MAIFNPHPLWEFFWERRKSCRGKFICMWLYYGSCRGNGTPTFDFFLSPYPLPDFSRGLSAPVFFWFVLVCVDSVRGSNLLESVRSGVGSPELGDEIGDKSIYRGIIGGYFKTSLLWGIVVPEVGRQSILGVF